jgi:hypothetical protein
LVACAVAIAAIALSATRDSEADILRSTLDRAAARATTASVSKDAGEPMAVFPEDPHMMLKRSIDKHPSYRCYLHHGTRNVTCVDSARVRSNGELRASELLAGRTERIRETGITLVVECTTMREVMTDRNGAPVSTPSWHSAEALRALGVQLCTAAGTVGDSTLRMF